MLRRLPYALWLLLAGISAAQNGSRTPQSVGVIAGQVVEEPGSMPLRKVLVSLQPSAGTFFRFPNQPQDLMAVLTDAQGQFRFERVPAGEYRVSVERNGFVESRHRSPQYSSTLLSLPPGHELTGLLFRMLPAAIVKGKITDADGDPIPGVAVVAVPSRAAGQYGNVATNDLGEYRVAGLSPGRYFIRAQSINNTVLRGSGEQAWTYAPTYYPGSLDRNAASPLQVHAGDEATADFTLLSS
ncbi:MAG: carboxypeptidase regulatory-like domain-containing protein, partial [Acidobacteria bacterium]|nr:carboxypeptidase regulatory-like domain-containing protein [Acidobacteriota bacterium]